MLRYTFPEHWSFMWGEIALYCFVVLVATGIYLALFFDPSYRQVIYHGPYVPLRGQRMSAAYASAVDLSWKIKAGLLMRQTHHWAADVFVAAITVHMLRVFFTGAFRKPRELTYWVGLVLLILALLEGYMGYSLVDDLLSGMGLAIGWSVAMSIPIVGGPFATWLWGGQFPGSGAFESRMYIAHVLILPILIATLIAVHLLFVTMLHHTQFRGRGRREQNVVGAPMWPAYAFRSTGLFFAVAGGLFTLGGLVQINPVWLWGPYHPYIGENGAQPDWYLGWLIGALRMMPNWEPTLAGHTIVPNPFWGGALFPLVVFGLLFSWPLLERRLTGDRAVHHLLERPRDNPWRTGCGVALFTFTAIPFFSGSMDRVYLQFGIPYEGAVRVLQVLWIVLPVVFGWAALVVCRNLRASELRPLRGVTASMVARDAAGGFQAADTGPARPAAAAGEDDREPLIARAAGRAGRVAAPGHPLLAGLFVGSAAIVAIAVAVVVVTAAVVALETGQWWPWAAVIAVAIAVLAAWAARSMRR